MLVVSGSQCISDKQILEYRRNRIGSESKPVYCQKRFNVIANFQLFIQCFAEKKAGKRKMPAIRSREITYRLCKALKECLCITQALTCIELQGLPLRDRDLAAMAKVWSMVYL